MRKPASLILLMALPSVVHALSGQVTDASGKPVSNATIDVVGSQVRGRTDTEGRFDLDTGGAPVAELHITSPGYSHKTLHLDVGNTEPLQVTLLSSAMEQVDVIGTPLHLSVMESAQPVTVVAGDDLRRKQAATLGETLKNEVGVHSSYFGPVASSPIIRGLNGPRVLVTQNGLDVSDASRVGPDHVVASEATTAKQIEILRGPATLFYGSGAIGGVVNVVDDRVPSSSESRGAFLLEHDTVNEGNQANLEYTGGTEQLAVHVDGFWRDGDDYEIPGAAEAEAAHEHEHDHEHDAEGHEEHAEGVLEDSAAEARGFNLGGSWLLGNGYVGLSYGRLEREYGIPGHSHAHAEEHGEEHHEAHGGHEDEHEAEDEGIFADLKQDRWQLISELSLDSAWLSGINTRIGYTDYEHREIENGEVGTIFRNETVEARLDLLLQEVAGWRGALSLEAETTDFEATGEEAFTPPSTTDNFAVALVEEKHIGDFLWQLGARVEKVTIDADPIEWEAHQHGEEEGGEHEHTLLHFDELDFTPLSLSAGVVWDFAEHYNAGISLTHAQRAPSAAELHSFGPHIGTGAFEVGALFHLHASDDPHFHYNDDVDEEVSNNIDLTLRKHSGDIGWVVNLFYNQVEDFYYERNSGYASEDILGHDHEHEEGGEGEHAHHHGDLPVYVFEQADTTFYGLEAQLAWQFAAPLTLNLWGDSVRGELDDGGNLPRIPPVRLGSELLYQNRGWEAELAVSHYLEQDKVAAMESTTDAYTLVDVALAYTFKGDFGGATVYLKGTNLFDEEARVHSSFLKDRAPLPGRGFRIGLRGTF